jgi:S-adenosylmethionine:tRNA ribosyltransferase-isomerase
MLRAGDALVINTSTGREQGRRSPAFAVDPEAEEAPTVGMRFPDQLMLRLIGRGVVIVPVTLHACRESSRPERFRISAMTASILKLVRQSGNRRFALGTTALRALESAADELGCVRAMKGETSLYITPGSRIRSVDAVFTSMHPEGSTHRWIVSAFLGERGLETAYQIAAREELREGADGDLHLVCRHETR